MSFFVAISNKVFKVAILSKVFKAFASDWL